MTSERKKSILILSATLIVGILIGMLTRGFLHKYHDNHGDHHGKSHHGKHHRGSNHKGDWFVGTINDVVQPDSAQSKQIKPITDWASAQIELVENSSNKQMGLILDSVKVQLNPILNPEQQQRLAEFHTKACGKWKGKEGCKR